MVNYQETKETMYHDKHYKPNDTVKMYKEVSGISYPMVLLKVKVLESFRVRAMRGVVYESPKTGEENYAIYVKHGRQAVKIGYIPVSKLGYILHNNVFSVYEKKIYLDKETVFEGDMMYALCPPSKY